MSLTPQQLKSAFYAVLYSSTAAASVAVRSALGNGASSIIAREDLKATSLPAAPFLALWWLSQPSGGARNRGVRVYYPSWILYDSTLYRYARLEALEALIQAAYTEDVIAGCYIDFLPVRELTDAATNLPAKTMPFQIKMRG